MHLDVYCGIIYNSQDLKAAQLPISRWVDKKALVHLPSEILLGHNTEATLTFANSMDGPGEYHVSEVSQSEKDKYHMISLIWGI